MTEKEIQHIEIIIIQEIDKTEHSILNYKELTKPIAPENAIGKTSGMDAINTKSVNNATLKKSSTKT